MGQNTSKSETILNAEALFNNYEKQQIEQIVRKLCHPSVKEYFAEKDLKEFCDELLPDELTGNLYQFMVQVIPPGDKFNRGKSAVTDVVYPEDLLVALASMLKGSATEKARLVCCLATGQIGEPVMAIQVAKVLEQLLQSYISCLSANPEYDSWQLPEDEGKASTRFAKYLSHDLLFKGKPQCDVMTGPDLTKTFGEDEIEAWITRCPIFLHMMDTAFYTTFPITFTEGESLRLPSLIPSPEGADWSKFLTCLDLPSLLILNHSVPHELRSKWRFLYSTSLHGSSFTTFQSHVVAKGPTLVIIRDTDGNVFGGFAADSWESDGHFYGCDKCFLFSLTPNMDVYPSTGYNKHYQYFNHGQETLPNGLGMGGQLRYYGLWIDEEFGKGHSKAQPKCTTYNSPQLSKSEDFQIDYMEVWGIGEPPKKSEEEEEAAGSILDKDLEAKAMLSMIGKGPVSEGLRELDPDAESPGEHEAPH